MKPLGHMFKLLPIDVFFGVLHILDICIEARTRDLAFRKEGVVHVVDA